MDTKRTNKSILNEFAIAKEWLVNTMKKKKKLAYFAHIKRHQVLEKIKVERKMPNNRTGAEEQQNEDGQRSCDITRDLESDLTIAVGMTLFIDTTIKATSLKAYAN